MSEHDPSISIHLGDGSELEARRENTTLFTHLGRLACYDHVFITREQEDEVLTGLYIFRQADHFDDMEEYLIANDYPMVLNKLEVADCDVRAFEQMIHAQAGDLDEGIPEDWQK